MRWERSSDSHHEFQLGRVLQEGDQVQIIEALRRSPSNFHLPVLLACHNPRERLRLRLQDHAAVASKPNYRGVLPAHEIVELLGKPTLVLSRPPGGLLSNLLAQRPLSPRAAFELVAALAYNLGGELQKQGFVLRGVRPEGLWLTTDGDVLLLELSPGWCAARRHHTRGEMGWYVLRHSAPELAHGTGTTGTTTFALGFLLADLLGPGPVLGASVKPDVHARRQAEASARAQEAAGEEAAALLAEMVAWEPEKRPALRDVATRLRALAAKLGGRDLATWVQPEAPAAGVAPAPVPPPAPAPAPVVAAAPEAPPPESRLARWGLPLLAGLSSMLFVFTLGATGLMMAVASLSLTYWASTW